MWQYSGKRIRQTELAIERRKLLTDGINVLLECVVYMTTWHLGVTMLIHTNVILELNCKITHIIIFKSKAAYNSLTKGYTENTYCSLAWCVLLKLGFCIYAGNQLTLENGPHQLSTTVDKSYSTHYYQVLSGKRYPPPPSMRVIYFLPCLCHSRYVCKNS